MAQRKRAPGRPALPRLGVSRWARPWFRLTVILVAVAICAACGGGSADGSEGTTAAEGGGSAEAGGNRAPGGAESGSGGASGGGGESKTKDVSPAQEEAEERAAYESKRYGSPSPRSARFRRSARQGTLKHVPEYGVEAGGGERERVQELLTTYFDAVTAGDWPQACRYLLPYYIATLEASARAATGEARKCPEVLPGLFEEAAGQSTPEFPDTGAPQVASLRVRPYPPERIAELKLDVEMAGFALLHGSDGVDYYVSITRESGEWKLTTPMPHALS